MPVVQQGSINTTALIVPDVYVQIVPPAVALLNGVPSNVLGLVGTASWGPVNAPTEFSDMASFARLFGPLKNRKYDLGTAAAAAVLQGANNFLGVRVTDGSDVAATATGTISSVAQITFTSLYTGSLANGDQVTISPGSAANSWKVTVARPGLVPEVFDNIGAGLSGNALWVAIAAAVNTGTGLQGASQLVIASAGSGTASPSGLTNPLTLAGGTDGIIQSGALADVTITAPGSGYTDGEYPLVFTGGAGSGSAGTATITGGAVTNVVLTSVGSGYAIGSPPTVTLGGSPGGGTGATLTASVLTPGNALVGVDGIDRSGMYALRGTQASVAVLVDCDDTTTFATQAAFGLDEGIYMVGTTPSGDTISNAISTKATRGIDSYAFKYLFGDWVYFNDTVNNVVRAISPQGYVAGLLVNLSPEQSSLNKPLQGVVGTQKTNTNQVYSAADLQLLIGAGIDVICNPSPGGNYFSCRSGHNSSSNPLTNGDAYTRLTNYIAYTIDAGMGKYVGQLQTPSERDQAAATLSYFLGSMQAAGMIGDVNNPDPAAPAYSVQLNAANNPSNRVALGYQQADVKVKYLSVVEKFLINIEGSTATVIPSGNPSYA